MVIGLVYTYVLFMVFPLYNAMQSLDSNQIEAAEDLGSPWWRTHLAGDPAPCQAGHRLGLRVMVFMLSAGRCWCPRSWAPPRRAGSPKPSSIMLEGAGLEHRRGLCLHAAFGLHDLRQPDDAVFGVKLSDIAK